MHRETKKLHVLSMVKILLSLLGGLEFRRFGSVGNSMSETILVPNLIGLQRFGTEITWFQLMC